ncbi:PTS lactose transporter subunit IIC [Nocardioides phosphati]|uniref:PTS lactose transporter subunit IIC n=1 Tax=Nocardioides phosphati TaxID=1867775 RepID=A0ABQ2N995_9ACTN|nr:fructose-specific PTS transporter subunit EIIC [Nocardioides phosphati]GGO87423.1 PTS lactose transporter subunit IIC [Nocardioides phosphati]
MTQLITSDLVRLDAQLGSDKESVIRSLAGLLTDAGRTDDVAQLIRDVLAREETSPTGLKGGIAIPHCRTSAVSAPTLAFARVAPPVDFGAKDGPADIVFLIAAPDGGDAVHLQILTKLARALVKPAFTEGLRSATSADEVVALVDGVLNPAPAPAAEASAAAAAPAEAAPRRSLVAVTACPTGIAHTYMAAEALQAAAERAGVDIHVETQGSAGSTPLAASTIASASAVILAADVGVRDKARFAGLPVVASGVKRAVDDADGMIADALRYADDPAAPRVAGTADAAAGHGSDEANESWGARTRRILMTGVSYMIPFVAAGGLLIALSFLLGGYDITNVFKDVVAKNSPTNLPDVHELGLKHVPFDSGLLAYVASILFIIGKTAFAFFVPALAGYIAFAIADRPGIAPGFIMGGLATDVMQFGTPQTGFIGAIVGGVLAGLVAHWIAGRKVPSWARGLMPVLVIPLLTTLVVGTIMLTLLGTPISHLMTSLQHGLKDMSGANAVLLGIILGLMMAFDMGGPLNKVAYAFAATGIGAASLASDAPELKIMAAVMLAGMVPPLALALATVVRPGLFSLAERENGKAAWLLGASFITEGAIPFAAADPLRVIPSVMLGSAVTGGLSELFGVSLRAPHGGIFVLFAVDGVLGFAVALAAGTAVAALAVVLLKSLSRSPEPATV